jgi:hypothetical protein
MITDGVENAEKTAPSKETLENKPAPAEKKKEKKTLTDLNPAAPIADKIQEALAQSQTAEEEPKKDTPVQAHPEPAPAVEAPAPKQEVDINSDEWKKKILTPQEIDEDWTPAMQANEELMTALARLKEFIKRGMAAKVLTQDWLNEELSKVTNGHITSFSDKRALSPKLIKIVSPYIIKRGIELANAKKASQTA